MRPASGFQSWCAHGIIMMTAIAVIGASGGAWAQSTPDIHRYQKFRMANGIYYNLVDFHYDSRALCEDANRRSTAMLRTHDPEMTLVTETCLTRINDIGKAMMANRPTMVPYFTFQDLRIWLRGGGAEDGADLRLCQKLEGSSAYPGGRCIPAR